MTRLFVIMTALLWSTFAISADVDGKYEGYTSCSKALTYLKIPANVKESHLCKVGFEFTGDNVFLVMDGRLVRKGKYVAKGSYVLLDGSTWAITIEPEVKRIQTSLGSLKKVKELHAAVPLSFLQRDFGADVKPVNMTYRATGKRSTFSNTPELTFSVDRVYYSTGYGHVFRGTWRKDGADSIVLSFPHHRPIVFKVSQSRSGSLLTELKGDEARSRLSRQELAKAVVAPKPTHRKVCGEVVYLNESEGPRGYWLFGKKNYHLNPSSETTRKRLATVKEGCLLVPLVGGEEGYRLIVDGFVGDLPQQRLAH